MVQDPENVNVVTAEDGTVWVEIASTGSEDEATLLRGFLESEGIVANVEDVKFNMEPVNFGTMGEVRIYVPQGSEQSAKELLQRREQEYQRLDDDEETLVTDDGPALIDENARAESDDGATNS
jgi:hypothetical protein